MNSENERAGPRAAMSTRTGIVLALLMALPAGGCTPLTVAGMLMDTETAVSVTVTGDDVELSGLAEALAGAHDVQAEVEAIRAGAAAIRIIGAYIDVLQSLHWIAGQGLQLLANDDFSAVILEAALHAAF